MGARGDTTDSADCPAQADAAGIAALGFVGLVTVFLTGWVLTQAAHPAFNRVTEAAREVTAWANAAALVVLACVATRRPNALSPRRYGAAAFALLALGTPATAYGLAAEAAPPLLAGCVLLSMGRALVTVLVCLGCARLSPRTTAVCVAGAYLAAFGLREACGLAPGIVGLTLFFALPFASLAVGFATAGPALRQASAAEAPADSAVTKPSTLLPFGHQLFVSILAFRVVYGFVVVTGVTDGGLLTFGLAGVAFAVVLVCALCLKPGREMPSDALAGASLLVVVAGLLAFLVLGPSGTAVAGTLMMAGAGCFEIMVYTLLIALARRNLNGGVTVLAWGLTMFGVGAVLGATLARAAGALYAGGTAVLVAALLFCLVAYAVIFLHDFSFATTVSAVEAPDRVSAPDLSTRLDARCDQVAAERSLTARETDVLKLLARGRNVAYIQEELVLARNTVKVHVRHIYAKLDVHSQQELIDVVVAQDERGR